MKSIVDTIQDFEEIIRDNLKVKNASLLKTGALGTFANIMANVKYDTGVYYNKLIREINPATCTEFNSLLFHSSILNYDIAFSTPSTFGISFVVPEFTLRPAEMVTYEIDRDTQFLDNNGLYYTLEEDIKIFISNETVIAKRYSDTDINELEVSRVSNPNSNGYMYLVEYGNLKQYKREFYKFSIPYYEIGENYNFSVSIPNVHDIYEINAWIKPSDHRQLDKDLLYKYNSHSISGLFDLQKMRIKYNKFVDSQFDDNLYLTLQDNLLVFGVGDGLNGRKLDQGDQIYVEVKLTKGELGNINSTEMNIDNVLVTSEDEGGYKSTYRSLVKVISFDGGQGGKAWDEMPVARSKMIDHSSTRKSITSINDFEIYYNLDNGKPFVDPKFFNSKNHVFIYNIIRDEKQAIIPTTTFNIEQNEFQQNLFFPKREYRGIQLISPFYYKQNYNHYSAYMVRPDIKIELKTLSTVDKLIKLKNSIGLHLTYDYFEQKSRLVITNYNSLYSYKIVTNLFDVVLNVHNQFKQQINQRFLDRYCILEEDLIVKEVIVTDSEGTEVIYFQGVGSYFQLVKKQEHYYYTELDRLDSTKEKRHVLNIPFLDLNYMRNSQPSKLFTKLDSFFQVEGHHSMLPYNTGVTQSFYNTIYLEPLYRDYVIDINNNDAIFQSKNMIVIEIIVDKYQYSISDYESVEEVEYDIKNIIYETLEKHEGNEAEFYETILEKSISGLQIIKNVDVLSPKVFKTYGARQIYQNMDDALDTGLTIFDIVNFVPNYFYFDYQNMSIKIEIR
ncbi:MAG: hypothetical protein WC136_01810 [Sphaerochaeta sp.]|jgi:hypothetical protein